MSAGTGLRLFMIVVGVVILGMTILSLVKKHMTESFSIVWGIVSFSLIFAGIVLRPTQWNQYISWNGLLLSLFAALMLLAGAFYFSVRVSRLTREVRELAIQLSLLNQENEVILRVLTRDHAEIEMKTDEEKALVRN